jgi:hypothetical protein
MKSKILMALAAGAVALPMAIGSSAATAKTVAPPPVVDSKNTQALDKDNNQIQKNAARISAACTALRMIGADDTFAYNMNLNEIRQDETNLNYLAAKKAFDKGLTSVAPDPNDHSFDYLGDAGQILNDICHIGFGQDGGGG